MPKTKPTTITSDVLNTSKFRLSFYGWLLYDAKLRLRMKQEPVILEDFLVYLLEELED